jgi:hypothetical protein
LFLSLFFLLFFSEDSGAGGLPPPQWIILRPLTAAAVVFGATFLRCIELPEATADWSLTSIQLKLIKIGARVVRHARAITFQLAEVAITGPMVRAILAAIHRLRAPPPCA